MRSRVVPIKDMQHKFGAEVKSFSYAFVIANHAPGWEASALIKKEKDQEKFLVPHFPAFGNQAAPSISQVLSKTKPGKYIEVKSRN